MAEFLPPRMPEEDGTPASQEPLPPDRFGQTEPPPVPVETAPVTAPRVEVDRTRTARPGSLARLISLIVSVGLAWAILVATTAWLLGLFLARG